MPIAIFGKAKSVSVWLGSGPRLSTTIFIGRVLSDGPILDVSVVLQDTSCVQSVVCVDTKIVVRMSAVLDTEICVQTETTLSPFWGIPEIPRYATATLAVDDFGELYNVYFNQRTGPSADDWGFQPYPIDSAQRTIHFASDPYYPAYHATGTPNGFGIIVGDGGYHVKVQDAKGTQCALWLLSDYIGDIVDISASNSDLFILYKITTSFNGGTQYRICAYDIFTGEIRENTGVDTFIRTNPNVLPLSHLKINSVVDQYHFLRLNILIEKAPYIRIECDILNDYSLPIIAEVDANNVVACDLDFWEGTWFNGSRRRNVHYVWTAEHTLDFTHFLIDVTSWGNSFWDNLNDTSDFIVRLNNMVVVPSFLMGNIETKSGYIVVKFPRVSEGQTYAIDLMVYWGGVLLEENAHPLRLAGLGYNYTNYYKLGKTQEEFDAQEAYKDSAGYNRVRLLYYDTNTGEYNQDYLFKKPIKDRVYKVRNRIVQLHTARNMELSYNYEQSDDLRPHFEWRHNDNSTKFDVFGFYAAATACPNDSDLSINDDFDYVDGSSHYLTDGGYYYMSVLAGVSVSAWSSVDMGGYSKEFTDITLLPVDKDTCRTQYVDRRALAGSALLKRFYGAKEDYAEGQTEIAFQENTVGTPNNIFDYQWKVGSRVIFFFKKSYHSSITFSFETTLVSAVPANGYETSAVITIADPAPLVPFSVASSYLFNIYIEPVPYYDLLETVLVSPGTVVETVSAEEEASGVLLDVSYAIESECVKTEVALNIVVLSGGLRSSVFVRRYTSLQLRSPELVACSATKMNVEVLEIEHIIKDEHLGNHDFWFPADLRFSPRITATETKLFLYNEVAPYICLKDPSEPDVYKKREGQSFLTSLFLDTKHMLKCSLLPAANSIAVESSDAFGIACLFFIYNIATHEQEVDFLVFNTQGEFVCERENVVARFEDLLGTIEISPMSNMLAVSEYGALFNAGNTHNYPHSGVLQILVRLSFVDNSYTIYKQCEDDVVKFKRIIALGYSTVELFLKTNVICGATKAFECVKFNNTIKGTAVECVKSNLSLSCPESIKSIVTVIDDRAIRSNVKLLGEPFRRLRGLLHTLFWSWEHNEAIHAGAFFVKTDYTQLILGNEDSVIPSLPATTILSGRYFYGFVAVEFGQSVPEIERYTFLRCFDIQAQKFINGYAFSAVMINGIACYSEDINLNYSEKFKQLFLTKRYFELDENGDKTFTFVQQETLVFSTDLIALYSLNTLTGIPKDAVIWDIAERSGVFYALVTELIYRNEEELYKNLSVYTSTSLYDTWTLLHTIDYSMVFDVCSIHQVTATRIWITNNSDHYGDKSIQDIGIRLDGSGYDVLPGVVGFLQGLTQNEDRWYALTVKGIANVKQENTFNNITGVVIFDENTLSPITQQPEFYSNAFSAHYATGRAHIMDIKLYDFVKLDVSMKKTVLPYVLPPSIRYTHLPEDMLHVE